MTIEIHPYYVTFGVQYGRRPDDKKHPLGMHSDGYAVIEAPDMETARAIAFAIFDSAYAFIYDEQPELRYAPVGELMRISWSMESPDFPEYVS